MTSGKFATRQASASDFAEVLDNLSPDMLAILYSLGDALVKHREGFAVPAATLVVRS